MRSTRHVLLSLLAVATLGAAACKDNQDEAGARALWSRINGERYQEWRRAPNYETRRPSFTAHADAVEIFANPDLARVLDERKSPPITEWPVGSLVVKRGYRGSDGDLQLVAVMEKRADGWWYYEYDGEGSPLFSGRPSLCVDCHAKGADKIWSFGFPR
jgi:hypothetical protein